jgi:phosphohistidine phosphatase
MLYKKLNTNMFYASPEQDKRRAGSDFSKNKWASSSSNWAKELIFAQRKLMKILYLARHAKSSWENMNLSDIERPLNQRGLSDAPKMGDVLKKLAVKPDLIVCSPSKRTKDTLAQYIEKIGYPKDRIEYIPDLYEASCSTLLSLIKQQPDSIDSLMVVGHNQGLTELHNELCDHFIENIPTSGVVALKFDVEKWMQIKPNYAQMEFFEYPKKLTIDK